MKSYKKIGLLFFLSLTFSVYAQKQQQLSLDAIYKQRLFSSKYLRGIRSMQSGTTFTTLDGKAIKKYSYKDYRYLEDVVSSEDLNLKQKNIDGYIFSQDEQKILIAIDQHKIYRRSRTAKYFIYNRDSKQSIPLHDDRVMIPSFSPQSDRVAYVYKNDLYYKDLKTGRQVQITRDGLKNSFINGLSDWVYEEEFAIVKMYHWSSGGRYIAYLKFDEREVPVFSMDMFPTQSSYPARQEFKYPKAGDTNAKVSLHIYDTKTHLSDKVDLGRGNSEYYIPRIYWTEKTNKLYVYVSNRHQNQLELLAFSPQSRRLNQVYQERDEAYVDINLNKIQILSDDSFLWTSEKDGYNHIYHIDSRGKNVRQITKGNWQVTDFYGYDEKRQRLYYQSTEDGSINRSVYAIDFYGKNKTRLSTAKPGTNTAHFSKNYEYYINIYSNTETPYHITLCLGKNGQQIKVIEDNSALVAKLKVYDLPKVQFSQIATHEGIELNTYMIKPTNFDSSKKYPLMMFVYGGPGSQTVANRWNSQMLWFKFLAQRGYVVVSVDNRGTGYKGEHFKKMTYRQLGKYEIEDQIESAVIFGKRTYIDADRIGIYGWSYGGFMASLALTKGVDVFKLGIAVAPVTHWKYYNTIYTERYMRTPQENPDGYDNNSPITHTDKLKGKYLLIHGSGDDNVHYQNAMLMAESLVQSDKSFDFFIYPNKNHGIYGGNTTFHLRKKMTQFIVENL